jgi:AcrR family transcriptional regulator
MSPRTSAQFNEMRQNTKQKIMDSALELFANAGYYSTSISQIAKKAEISKGLMYNYFESKELLLKEIVFQGIDSITVSFDPNRDGVLTKEELEIFIKESFKLVRQQRTYWKLYFALMSQEAVMSLFKDELAPRLEGLFVMLTRYFHEQKYSKPEVEMRFFGALLDGIAMNFIMDPDGFPLDDVEEKIISMYTK